MAYLRLIDRKCSVRECTSTATYTACAEIGNMTEVEPVCRRHADAALKRAEGKEQNSGDRDTLKDVSAR